MVESPSSHGSMLPYYAIQLFGFVHIYGWPVPVEINEFNN